MAQNISKSQRQPISKGFTLTELLISIGIIAMLMALLFGVMGRLRESVLRTTDLSNLRQLTLATISYAEQNDGILPPGRMVGAAPGADNYIWTSYANCWKPLESLAPQLSQINSCLSVRQGNLDAPQFGEPIATGWLAGNVRLGWIYWAGRDDLWSGGTLKFRSLHRLSDHLTPSSQTLWTCACWDSAGNPGVSVCPHVGTRYVEYPSGVVLTPPPDGLGVALTDGSAAFVAWNDLTIVLQSNGYKLYYQP